MQRFCCCLLYTSDAADERSSVDLGGRRIIKKKRKRNATGSRISNTKTTMTDYAEDDHYISTQEEYI